MKRASVCSSLGLIGILQPFRSMIYSSLDVGVKDCTSILALYEFDTSLIDAAGRARITKAYKRIEHHE